MADVERAAQKPTAAGAVPTAFEGLQAADTQLIDNKTGDVILRVVNGGAEATDVTIVTPGQVGGNAVADRVVTVANGATKLIGPFDPETYNNAKGQLQVQFSKVASVKLEVTKVAL